MEASVFGDAAMPLGDALARVGEILTPGQRVIGDRPILGLAREVLAVNVGEADDPGGLRAWTATKSSRPMIRSPEQGQSMTQSGARQAAAHSQSLTCIAAQNASTTALARMPGA